MAITIRFGATVTHFQGLAERSKGSGFNYSVSACSGLSRSGHLMMVGETFETVREALEWAQNSGYKICKNCMKAAEASIEPEAEEVKEEQAAPEYRGHEISCPFFGPDYDHCDCGTESDARVIVEDTKACESCSHPMDEKTVRDLIEFLKDNDEIARQLMSVLRQAGCEPWCSCDKHDTDDY